MRRVSCSLARRLARSSAACTAARLRSATRFWSTWRARDCRRTSTASHAIEPATALHPASPTHHDTVSGYHELVAADLDGWEVRAHLGAESGPSVFVGYARQDGFPLLTPDGARELALALWEAADEAEGAVPSRTEPSRAP